MASSNSQIDKPQHGRPKRAELPNVNIDTGAQSINTERASSNIHTCIWTPEIEHKTNNDIKCLKYSICQVYGAH